MQSRLAPSGSIVTSLKSSEPNHAHGAFRRVAVLTDAAQQPSHCRSSLRVLKKDRRASETRFVIVQPAMQALRALFQLRFTQFPEHVA
jgi:hypothetical protein